MNTYINVYIHLCLIGRYTAMYQVGSLMISKFCTVELMIKFHIFWCTLYYCKFLILRVYFIPRSTVLHQIRI